MNGAGDAASVAEIPNNTGSAATPRNDGRRGLLRGAGFYESMAGKKYPRVQLLTIEDLLDGKERAECPDYEPDLNFKKAKAAVTDAPQRPGFQSGAEQTNLL